jgi:hypothetical protein
MPCASCASNNQIEFATELGVHYPSFRNRKTPSVLVFPQVSICMDCGLSLFTVPETELRMLRDGH